MKTQTRALGAPFCAICCADVSGQPERLEPLGKAGALVRVCDDCATEVPREARGPRYERHGYEIREGASQKSIIAAGRRVLAAVGAPNETKRQSYVGAKTPGWIVVRVARKRPDQTTLDLREALETLRGRPWFAQLRILGTDLRWHLFERPDPKKLAAQRARSDNPLAWLEPFEVKP